MFLLRTLFKSPSKTSDLSECSVSSKQPHSTPEPDRYPFPTNTRDVKRSKHHSHPRYLPEPNASVREVRYFLYTLLTSDRYECAILYPEWVLETCMGFDGNGHDLRNHSTQQLLHMCPIIAVANGIQSTKHKPGSFVPVRARAMIGEVIAGYVMNSKARESQAREIHLHWEQSQAEMHYRPSTSTLPGRRNYTQLLRDRSLSVSRPASRVISFNCAPDAGHQRRCTGHTSNKWTSSVVESCNMQHLQMPRLLETHCPSPGVMALSTIVSGQLPSQVASPSVQSYSTWGSNTSNSIQPMAETFSFQPFNETGIAPPSRAEIHTPLTTTAPAKASRLGAHFSKSALVPPQRLPSSRLHRSCSSRSCNTHSASPSSHSRFHAHGSDPVLRMPKITQNSSRFSLNPSLLGPGSVNVLKDVRRPSPIHTHHAQPRRPPSRLWPRNSLPERIVEEHDERTCRIASPSRSQCGSSDGTISSIKPPIDGHAHKLFDSLCPRLPVSLDSSTLQLADPSKAHTAPRLSHGLSNKSLVRNGVASTGSLNLSQNPFPISGGHISMNNPRANSKSVCSIMNRPRGQRLDDFKPEEPKVDYFEALEAEIRNLKQLSIPEYVATIDDEGQGLLQRGKGYSDRHNDSRGYMRSSLRPAKAPKPALLNADEQTDCGVQE